MEAPAPLMSAGRGAMGEEGALRLAALANAVVGLVVTMGWG